MIRIKKLFLFVLVVGTLFSAVQAQETSASVYNDGLAKLKSKSYDSGLELMEKALKMAEEDGNEKVIKMAKKNGAIAAYNLANSQKKANDLDAAEVNYKKGMELNPSYAGNFMGLGSVMQKKENFADAIKYYLQSGEMYSSAGKVDNAQKIFNQIKVILGKLYVAEKYDEVLKLGEPIIDDLKNPSIAYYVAGAAQKSDDNQKGLDIINKAISLAGDKTHDKYFVVQASAYEGLGNKAEAIAALKKITSDKYAGYAKSKIAALEAQ